MGYLGALVNWNDRGLSQWFSGEAITQHVRDPGFDSQLDPFFFQLIWFMLYKLKRWITLSFCMHTWKNISTETCTQSLCSSMMRHLCLLTGLRGLKRPWVRFLSGSNLSFISWQHESIRHYVIRRMCTYIPYRSLAKIRSPWPVFSILCPCFIFLFIPISTLFS